MSYVLILRDVDHSFKVEVANKFYYSPNVTLEVNKVGDFTINDMVERMIGHIIRRYKNSNNSARVFVMKTGMTPYLNIRITINSDLAITDLTNLTTAITVTLFTLLYIDNPNEVLSEDDLNMLSSVSKKLDQIVVEYPEANK